MKGKYNVNSRYTKNNRMHYTNTGGYRVDNKKNA